MWRFGALPSIEVVCEECSFHRFAGAQIFIYKRLLTSRSSRNSFDDGLTAKNRQCGTCVSDTVAFM